MGVGLRLKGILRLKKMTIKQLAEKSGISVNTLYSITKRDSSRVDRLLLQQIAKALDISVYQLLGESKIDGAEKDLSDSLDLGLLAIHLHKEYDLPTETALKVVDDCREAFSIFFRKGIEVEMEPILDDLNDRGKQVALERVRELAEIPQYQSEIYQGIIENEE